MHAIKLVLVLALCLTAACRGSGNRGGRYQFRSEWTAGPERPWVGPDYYACRLQDWRLRAGRVECVLADESRPVRALHLLTAALSERRSSVTLSVRTGALETERPPDPASFSGFLIGSGGAGIDYRLTALVHHRPAKDGGLICAVDGNGRVAFRDFEHNAIGGGWTVGNKLHESELAEIPATRRKPESMLAPSSGRAPEAFELVLEIEPAGRRYDLTLVANDPETGLELDRATLEGVDQQLVDGGLALVSHLGPQGSSQGFWFEDWLARGRKLARHPERAFGPILGAQYTISRGTLKLTAQLPPLGPDDARTAELQVKQPGRRWETVASAPVEEDAWITSFRVEEWDARRDVPYRVLYSLVTGPEQTEESVYTGTLRAEPLGGELVLGALTCVKHFTGGILWNHDAIWFPHNELTRSVACHDPDLLFFSGDQIYEGDLTGAQRAPLAAAMLDYLDKWYRWHWSFRDLTRDRPSITIPDDHDVYHGNLWGAGGRFAKRQDDGGYTMPARFVRMVERTQTSHLPDPFDPTPVEQGIGVYYTSLEWGGLSFAILEDRKFKSSATPLVPDGNVKNGWFQDTTFDARDSDVPSAALLGRRQLDFLSAWGADWSGDTWMKVALSQTLFTNLATIPEEAKNGSVLSTLEYAAPGEYPSGYKLAADTDSGGWPQSGRNRALRELRRAFAMHVCGDQHLASFVRYGIDEWDDAGYAFCVPAIANTWPRRWYPPEPGEGRGPDDPPYTGRFHDGFGNKMTVAAVANPVKSGHPPEALNDRVPGYGILRFDRATREITVECWPRWVDPRQRNARQYEGWPVTIRQQDNYDRPAVAHLPTVQVLGIENPVMQVIEEATGEIVYTLRVEGPRTGTSWRPPVFELGRYTLRVGEPESDRWRTVTGIEARLEDQGELLIDL